MTMPNDKPTTEVIPDVEIDATAFPNWPDWTPRDNASLVLPRLDYESQLLAIKDVLRRNAMVDKLTDETVEALNQHALRSTGVENQRVVDEWVDTLHNSTYQSAALSMSALGMLAPLYESLFSQAFYGIRHEFIGLLRIDDSIRRVGITDKDFWECRTYIDREKDRKQNVFLGTRQLAKAIGLSTFLPESLWNVFDALISYRNMMFHNGFEWPEERCEAFAKRIHEGGWDAWFSSATVDARPWMFYMTKPFVEECLEHINKVLESIGRFVDAELERHHSTASSKVE
jgi:hypothetical protein